MDHGWRPSAAIDIGLNDCQLAQMGLMAAYEAQAKMFILLAVKGAMQLTFDEYRRYEHHQFRQLVDKLAATAERLDATLSALVANVREHMNVLDARHHALHNVWSESADGSVKAWDMRRSDLLTTEDLAAALHKLGGFTFIAQACALRVADLISDGVLPGGSRTGPAISMRWRDGLVTF